MHIYKVSGWTYNDMYTTIMVRANSYAIAAIAARARGLNINDDYTIVQM